MAQAVGIYGVEKRQCSEEQEKRSGKTVVLSDLFCAKSRKKKNRERNAKKVLEKE